MHREVKPHAAINTATLYKTEEEASVAPTNILQVSVVQCTSTCRAALQPSLHIIMLCMWYLIMLFLLACLPFYTSMVVWVVVKQQHHLVYCMTLLLLS